MLTQRVRIGSAIAAALFSALYLALWPAQESTNVKETPPLFAKASASLSIQNYNANGSRQTLSCKQLPERVVITHPGATELLLELGLGDRILATVPPYGEPLPRLAAAYASLPKLHASFVPSREEMYALQPDLIIGWPHHFVAQELGDADLWQRRGAAAYVLPGSLTSGVTFERAVYGAIADFGEIFLIRAQTDRYIETLRTRVSRVQESLRSLPLNKTVLILQSHGNSRFSLYGRNQLVSDLAELAGATNLAIHHANFVGAEEVLRYDPDFIVYVTLPKNGRDLTQEEAAAEAASLRELHSMRALQQEQLVALPFFTVNNGGIRSVDAVEILAHALYPERFAAQH